MSSGVFIWAVASALHLTYMVAHPPRIVSIAVVLILVLPAWPVRPVVGQGLPSHAPIFIDGNGGFTSTNGVVGGSGKPSNPYLIQDWSISRFFRVAVKIRNTNAYFVLRNVDATQADEGGSGLHLVNVTNAGIERSFFSAPMGAVLVENSYKVSFSGNTIFGSTFNHGVQVSGSKDIVFSNNRVFGNGYGAGPHDAGFGAGVIFVDDTRAVISKNMISGNAIGLIVVGSRNVKIYNNSILGNQNWFYNSVGLELAGSFDVSMSGNIFVSNSVQVDGSIDQLRSYKVKPDNLVDGYPLLYYKDCSNRNVDSVPVGQLIIVNCENIRIANLRFTGASTPIQMSFVNDAMITGNFISGKDLLENVGLRLLDSRNVTISKNSISGGGTGIELTGSSTVAVFENYIHHNYGDGGLVLRNTDQVIVFHNNFFQNGPDAWDRGADVLWDAGYPLGGNFWDRQTLADLCSGPSQDVCNGPDGIGDSAVSVYPASIDRYPLMIPFHISTERDIVPPTEPRNLTATLVNSSQVNLSWQASVDDVGVAGYSIFRLTVYENLREIGTVPGTVTSYSDSSVGESAIYYFYLVFAFDESQNLSEPVAVSVYIP